MIFVIKRLENPLPFEYNQLPYQPPEHANVMNLPPHLETMVG